MRYGTNLISAVVLCATLIPSAAFADLVVLKTGKALNVEKAWQQGDQVWFIFHGMQDSIPQSKVHRVVSDAHDQKNTLFQKNEKKADLDGYRQIPAKDVSSQQAEQTAPSSSAPERTVMTREPSRFLRKDGFCDLQWGVEVSRVEGLEKQQTDSELDEVVEYVRRNDIQRIGDTPLTSIIYAFWRNQLYTVTIWTQGYPNYKALRDKVFDQFGKGHQAESSREKYLWSDDAPTEMMLEYLKNADYGMLWLRSRELDRKYKLSKLIGPTSYLKWMDSKTAHP